MSFLHFGLLPYFLPLVAVPILLHLLTLHRLKTVELSTFRFLFDSYVQQRRRMKFLEALIAFLRTLFLLILVLLICRPVVKHWSAMFGGSQTGRDVVLLIDGSASMNAVTEGITSLERAKRAAIAVTDRLSVDDRVTVIRVAAKPEEVCNRFSSDAEAIRNEIESLQATPSRGNLFAAFSQLFGPESRRLNEPAIYLFSDLQSTGWDEFIDGTSTELIPPDTELTVVNVGSNQEFANVAVVGQSPEDQRAIAGLPIKLNPRVTNYSETESRDIPVSIFIEDKEIASAIRFIHSHLNQNLHVDDVVRIVPLSRRALYARFKDVLGRSIGEEIRTAKMDYAARMLMETDLPISAIATKLGFDDAKNLARAFRQAKGLPPLKYRMQRSPYRV